MRKIISLCFVVLICHFAQAQETFPTNGAPTVDHNLYVLKGATVHVDPSNQLSNADVWVREGRIVKVSSGEPIPAHAISTDCRNRHIYASFIDLYSDYGMPKEKREKKSGPNLERSEKGAYGWNEAIRPEIHAIDHFKQDVKTAEKLRSSGFGAVLSQQKDGLIRGSSTLIAIGDKSENLSVLKPKAAQGMSFKKGSSNQDYPSSRMGAIALIKQSLYDEQWYRNEGDKVEYNLSLAELETNMGLPQIFTTSEKNDISRADKIGDEFSFQYIFIGTGNEYERAQDVSNANGLVVLPLNFPEAYDVSDPYASKYISLHDMRHWEQAPANAAFISSLGVEIAFTTDGLKEPKQLLNKVRQCIQQGLSKEAALKALTTAPATALGMESQLGIIRQGALANFLVCDGDLFDKGTKILENWVQGVSFEVNVHDETELSGIYDLNLDGIRYSFTIQKNKGKEKVFISPNIGSDTTNISVKLKEHERQVNMTFEIPNKGLYRLHGTMNSRLNIWTGKGESPSGKLIDWNLIRKRNAEEVKATTKEKNESKISVLKYPNNGYGWSEKPKSQNLIIRNATLWSNSSEGIMTDADIVISDGKIVAVGHNLNVSDIYQKEKEQPDFTVIDAYGKHLTSGIIDEHSHIAITGGVNESGQASSAEVSIGDVIHPEDLDIYYQLAGGVTASQLLHGSANPIGGQSALIKLRWGLNAEGLKIEGADGFIKFALGENVKQSNWGERNRIRFPQTRMGVEQVYYDHFHRARAYDIEQKKHIDNLQAYQKSIRKGLPYSVPRKDLELDALAEILNKKRFITCHSYVQSEINMLMTVADSMDFRINTFTHILEGYKVADKMAKHGVGGSTFSDWWAYKYEVREATPYNAALMHDMGITVAINSDDAEMGRRLNQEAAKGVKYGGMSEEEAWKMVTLNPAKLLHLDDRMGSLEVGKDADIVIWSDNPLSIYAKAEKTFIDGVCYFDIEKDKKARDEIKLERARLIQKMMGDSSKNKQKPSGPDKHRYHCDHEGE